jgi:ribonuclease HII
LCGLIFYEEELWSLGYKEVMGIDEAGRGALSGPLVVAGVVFEKDKIAENSRDSKILSPKVRETVYFEILKKAKKISVSIVPHFIIDKINIYNATILGAKQLVLKNIPDYLLIDAFFVKGVNIPQIKLIKGEEKSISIAAASIIAKVTRDNIMKKLHKFCPLYGWDKNKGYPTKVHIQAISEHGISPFHRRSYGPCKT